MGQRQVNKRTHQCWWEDLRPWVEQLYAQFGLQTTVEVVLPADRHAISPGIVLICKKPRGAWGADVELRDWCTFNPNETGAAESAALRMISAMLLRLEDDRAESEAKQTSFLG